VGWRCDKLINLEILREKIRPEDTSCLIANL
jgi:hypothetical protein